ncbi:MAG: lyase family protein [Nitrososphaerota archaeon]|nr:lyase family protein [Candidatus Calditenuaceae archaeon]MDW8073994.1 lyase family protein [Nitrososphaerota archaeon]
MREAVSPVDGRYRALASELARYFSEEALMRYRLMVEAEYLKHVAARAAPHMLERLSAALKEIVFSFDEACAAEVKGIEAGTRHDVEAVVRFLGRRLEERGLGEAARLVHIGLTSEDVNNLAYSLALRDAITEAVAPALELLMREVAKAAYRERNTVTVARTHGQPAVPTTLGKELSVHAYRLLVSLRRIGDTRLPGKVSGAVGTYAGLVEVFGGEALDVSRRVVESLGLVHWVATKQVVPHDDVSRLLYELAVAAMALVDLCRDLWLLSMLGIIYPRPKGVGSSTMPQKSNPVELENAEGNLEMAANMLSFLASRLLVSRLQRDLSDSTIRRNYGVALAHLLIGAKNLAAFLDRMEVDSEEARRDLERHPEVVAEAVQIRARLRGVDVMEELRALGRGGRGYLEEVGRLLEEKGLKASEIIPESAEKYIGLAPLVAELVFRLVEG